MAFTGDLAQLHIVDLIQLLNTTRKSGTFSVKSSRGESRIIFSNGNIVGASHLNNRILIGTVLVKMNSITQEDLVHAIGVQKNAGDRRKPLMSTLIDLGRLKREDAAKGLRKLIVMTLVELIGWTEGTFTLDTDVIAVSPDCNYPLSKMEQEISIDAQIILMDALRIYDERERDRRSGKVVPSDEEEYADLIALESPIKPETNEPVVTADDLGLGGLDNIERKIPGFAPVIHFFDPLHVHRQKIRDTLEDFPAEEQESFISFLGKSSANMETRDRSQKKGRGTRALVLFGADELTKHSVMTICKEEGVLVFATAAEDELFRIIEQCMSIKLIPVVAFDSQETQDGRLSGETIAGLRQRLREKYLQVPVLQMVTLPDYRFAYQALRDGVRTVFPKPSRGPNRATFIQDTITFLGTFRTYIEGLFNEQQKPLRTDNQLGKLRERVIALQNLVEPSAVSLFLLQYVAEICERAIVFILRSRELTGEKAIGLYTGKNEGPVSATGLKIPLSTPSVFLEVIDKGRYICEARDDDVLRKHLFDLIGAPLRPEIILLPLKSRGKTMAIIYGDFGGKDVVPIHTDTLEILASEAGLIIENALYRKLLSRASVKRDTLT